MLEACPAFFIDYVQIAPTIVAGASIESLHMPARCTKKKDHCEAPLVRFTDVEATQALPRGIVCKKCGGELALDPSTPDFFGFVDQIE